jgi:hypothetical protein
MYRKWNEERLKFSQWLLIFFIVMTIGFFIIFIIYLLLVPDINNVAGLPKSISGIVSIFATSILFGVGLILLERDKLLPVSIIIGLILAAFAVLTSLDPSLVQIETMISRIGTLLFVIPTVILFLYLYLQTKSTKSFAFSAGMFLQLLAGFSFAISPDLFAIISLLAAVVIHLGIIGFLDKILPSETT